MIILYKLELLFAHHIEEFVIVFSALHLIEQEFHRINGVHGGKKLAQDPDLVENTVIEKEFFLTGTGTVDVDSREDSFSASLRSR